MWRPKNWQKIVDKNFDIHFDNHNWNHTFEAGADAILKALLETKEPILLVKEEGTLCVTVPLSRQIMDVLLSFAIGDEEPQLVKLEDVTK